MPLRDRIRLWLLDLSSKRGLYLGQRAGGLHAAVYRRTGGRLGGHVPGWKRARILILDHAGAKTGARRSSPVIYAEHGDALVVVASKAGQRTNPAWFHNLMANPETSVQVGHEVRAVRARIATKIERDELWPRLVAIFPAYAIYEANAVFRKLPVLILDPS